MQTFSLDSGYDVWLLAHVPSCSFGSCEELSCGMTLLHTAAQAIHLDLLLHPSAGPVRPPLTFHALIPTTPVIFWLGVREPLYLCHRVFQI